MSSRETIAPPDAARFDPSSSSTQANTMPVTIGNITEAFEFANTNGDLGEFRAFVCRRTGNIHYQTDFIDAAELNDELPEDIDDEDKYIALPDKRELKRDGIRFDSLNF
ncbi:hypothetical protein ACU4GH_21590 [Bradyrhizobium betae]